MVTRKMWDATSPNLIPAIATMRAGYLTGTPFAANWAGHYADVWIDQAGAGAPRYDATVMDTEPGAYRPGDVPNWTSQCTAPRPTVYCDRTDYPTVRTVWSGDLWLAYPGATKANVDAFTSSILGHVDNNIVACQNVFTSNYDASDIYDPIWPAKGKDMIHGALNPGAMEFVPFPPGSFREVLLYHDFDLGPHTVRVAAHSVASGYAVTEHVITHDVPESVVFTATDVDGVSLANGSTVPVGYTLA